MRWFLLVLLLGTWLSAIAQTSSAEDPVTEADAVEQALPPCDPQEELVLPDGEMGIDEPGDAEIPSAPCVESGPATLAPEQPLPADSPSAPPDESGVIDESLDEVEDAATVKEESGAEASADEEFKPGDEISEDYPVPLPSDI